MPWTELLVQWCGRKQSHHLLTVEKAWFGGHRGSGCWSRSGHQDSGAHNFHLYFDQCNHMGCICLPEAPPDDDDDVSVSCSCLYQKGCAQA